MQINLNLLPIRFNDDIEIPKSFYEKTDIKELKNIHIDGVIDYNITDEVEINIHLTGKMILVDSITLEDITNNIDININRNLEEITNESTFFYEKGKNILDLQEFLWENIVLEVPISKTLASGTVLKGKGWSLNKTDDGEEINEEFLKLNNYFKGGE